MRGQWSSLFQKDFDNNFKIQNYLVKTSVYTNNTLALFLPFFNFEAYLFLLRFVAFHVLILKLRFVAKGR